MSNANSSKLAVLIDADNAQASVVKELMAEVAKYGAATVKRAYGDWTTPNLAGWKDVLHDLAIQPIQQFRFTVGKNATDSALIIDAMDILHSGAVLAVAEATARAIQMVAETIRQPGGIEAVNLRVADRYVDAFGNLAKTGNTLIVPANLADVSSLIASALTVVKSQGASPRA